MPNVTVYIRVGDLQAWKNMPNKSQAIHDMLELHTKRKTFDRSAMLVANREARTAGSGVAPQPVAPAPTYDGPELVITPKANRATPAPAPSNLTANLPENIRGAFVKADTIAPPPKPTEEMPCCKEAAPCRHWVWNINEGDGYINTISGRKKITE